MLASFRISSDKEGRDFLMGVQLVSFWGRREEIRLDKTNFDECKARAGSE